MKFEDIEIGDKAKREKEITEEVVEEFAEVSGDKNPLHIDEEIASESIFGERIVHGMIGASLISAVLGNELPGPGSIYLSQSLQFTAPVRVGEKITAEVEVKEKIPDENNVKLKTTCKNHKGEVVIKGEAICKLT